MKPGHLLVDELNYELRIRGIVTERKDVNVKRKLLAKQLEKDRNRARLEYVDPLYNYENEVTVINKTLDSIRLLIEDFDGPESDSTYKRICSRIAHITGRVKRLVVPDDESASDVTTFKNESFASCLELEVLLQDRVKREVSFLDASGGAVAAAPPVVQNVITNTTKLVPVYKWGVQYSGEPGEGLLTFLERVEELCISRHVDKKALYESAVELFTGDALVWYRSAKNSVHDWDSLVALLKKDFLPSDYTDQLWDTIRARLQLRGEPIQVFVAQMEHLFSRLGSFVAETTKLKYVRKNMLPHYIVQLALTPISNLSDLVRLCKKIDEAHLLKRGQKSSVSAISGGSTKAAASPSPNRAPAHKKPAWGGNRHSGGGCTGSEKPSAPAADCRKPIPPSSAANTSSTVCWNCKQPNHRFSSCLARRNKFCFKCGRADITVKECPCSKN